METEPNTPRSLILWGAREFDRAGLAFEHGTDNALDEAAWLVLHALGIGCEQRDEDLDATLEAGERQRVMKLLRARIDTRKPAAYLLGEAWFAGLPFHVDERVLVPRSPIAELISAQFTPWIDPARVRRILDLCTGSGCIGIACARAFPQAGVELSDVSRGALAVADANIARHRLQDRVSAVESNIFSELADRRYDIIVTNPPYVPAGEYRELPAEYRHEPGMGLIAGADGLDIVVQILRHAASHLTDGGILVAEVGYGQDRLAEIFPDVSFLWLEFEFGGGGVFLLDATQLVTSQPWFDTEAQRREAQQAITTR
ncbi:MAG: 50S ribosomal protein L3 N(5)-glutamine methyltransferase [Gammaproteobacteria bacterium]|jgi:ribosomal protein L3 glutamine methyltransferase